MARIAGVNIPQNKIVQIGLTYIHGIGNKFSKQICKDLDISSEKFWEGFDNAVHDLAPKNNELIQTREKLQKKIDDWHIKN